MINFKNRIQIYIILIFYLICISSGFSQESLPSLDIQKKIHHYVHTYWTMEDGLPSNSIWEITQTDDGYLWLATYHGLVRFDGITFKTFDRKNTPQFRNNKITTISKGANNSLWVITADNFLVHYSNRQFKKYLVADSLLMGDLKCLYKDDSNNIWIGCSKGLLKYNGKNFEKIYIKDLKHGIVSVVQNKNGTIWIATTGSGIYKYENDKFSQLTLKDGIPSMSYIRIISDRNNGLWVETSDRKIYNFKNNKFIFLKAYLNDRTYIFADRIGSLWFGNVGLMRFYKNKIDSFNLNDGLRDNRVRSIYEDNEGNIWVGSYAGGLEQLKNAIIQTISNKDGVTGKEVWSVYEDSKENLWLGTGKNTAHLVNNYEITKSFDFYKISNKRYAKNLSNILGFVEDMKGQIWIASSIGLFKYKNKKMVYIPVLLDNPPISLGINKKEPNSLIIGTIKGIFDYKNKKISIKYPFMNSTEWIVRKIYNDLFDDNVIWYATNKGLVKATGNKIKVFTKEDGLVINDIDHIYQSKDSTIWLATNGGGLNRLKNGKISSYKTDDGLHDDILWAVQEDNLGRLWMTCDRGLFNVSIEDLNKYDSGTINTIKSNVFDVSDGLRSSEFMGSGSAGTKLKNNNLVFPTMDGAAILNPNNDIKKIINPKVYIEDVTVNGIKIKESSNIVLNASAKNIDLHYTAIGYSFSKKIKFKYKLENYDKDWVDAGNRRIAFYTDIPPGDYKFLVKATNNIGQFNSDSAELKFKLKAKIYTTWWFLLLSLLLLIVLIYTFFHSRLVHEKARYKKLHTEIKEREKAQKALKDSEMKLQAIFDNSKSIMYMKDIQGKYLMVNRGFEEINKISKKYIINKTAYDILPFETAANFEASDREVIERNEIIEFEDRIKYEDGYHTFLSIRFPLKNTNNTPYAVCGISTDITDRKKAEEELKHLRNYLANIVNSMPSVLVGVDVNGKVTQWNKKAEITTGISAEKANGQILSDVFKYLELEMDEIKDSIKSKQIKHEHKMIKQNKKGICHHDITIFPLVANGVDGAVIRVDDVTEKVRLEEMIIQNEKMLSVGGLAAGMAHEINNPLAGILQNMQVIKNRLSENLPKNIQVAEDIGTSLQTIIKYMEERDIFNMFDGILDSGKRAARIIENMLKFSRKSESKFEKYNIRELLDQTVELAKSDYDLKKKYDFQQIKIIKEYEKNIPKILCEGTEIQQVFLNILKNGAQAMWNDSNNQKPQFNLSIKKVSDFILIEIKDNGPGIKDEIKRRIFEPFFTTKQKGIGTGLGLSVSFFIINENHKGKMYVESTVGVGTQFIIQIPINLKKLK